MCEEIVRDEEISKLQKSLTPLIDRDGGTVLILDFANVQFVSSSTLGFLVKLKNTITKCQGRLKLCCMGNEVKNAPNDRFVYEIFKVMKLDLFFDIYDSVEEALRSAGEETVHKQGSEGC